MSDGGAHPHWALVAHAENGAIGMADGSLPWRLPNDLKRLRALTLDHAVLMGRVTFETLPKPLDRRTNIVLTRAGSFPGSNDPAVRCVSTVDEVHRAHAACAHADRPLIVLGGEQVYRLMMPLVGVIERTLVHDTPNDAAAFFPDPLADGSFAVVWEERHGADERHSAPYTFQRLERIAR